MTDRVENEGAWPELRRRLALTLATLGENGTRVLLEVELGAPGTDEVGPVVQVGPSPQEGLRCEVGLPPTRSLDEAGQRVLAELGYGLPADGTRSLDLGPDEADRAADVVVTTLRDALGVLDPAFLVSEEIDLEGLRSDVAEPAAGPVPPPLTIPAGPEHLQQLVDATLAAHFGSAPPRDPDGDSPVPAGSGVVFVRPDDERPLLHLTAHLVVELPRPDAVQRALPRIAARVPFLSLAVVEDELVARSQLPAAPFVAEHLMSWVARFAVEAELLADEVAAEHGGRLFLEPPGGSPGESPGASPPRTGHPEGRSSEAADQRRLPAERVDQALVGVVELLHDGPVPARHVATLFDDDRVRMIRAIVAVRNGRVALGETDADTLAETVRRGLHDALDRHVRPSADGPAAGRRGARGRGRSHQLSLLGDDQDEQPLFADPSSDPEAGEPGGAEGTTAAG
ncbi:T3SS (YopN, CesT) and YbjN peptide-binding chaperone 1 [Nocardioides bruguierae]|uniref:T3SS (YopN, CesT) and YbjN peptide-binding chaperone 1 n=1 Tax=Nocardioides bruguierae TaxID=2945102 RepID=UPI0020225F87|nr:hypothetical protein [Nocardioides bruguierae]MCL8025041.1 hypothetical protein [Nocardioides bruguierae]